MGLGSLLKKVAKVAAPAVGGLLGGPVGASLGSAVSGWLAQDEAYDQTNAINNRAEKLSDRQMEFQRDMSNTAYQRAMKDMRKAGLNPILAYKMGGASTPAGAQPKLYNPAESVATGYQAMQAASNTYAQGAQVEKIGAEIEKIAQETKLNAAQTELLKETVPKVQAEVKRIEADAGFRRAITAIPQMVSDLVGAVRSLGDIADGSALKGAIKDMLTITIKKDSSDYEQEDKPWFDWSWSERRRLQ